MKTSHKFLVIAGLISITFIVTTLQAQIRPPDRVRSRTEISSEKLTTAQLESSILAVMEEHHIPGVAALIVKDDSVIWSGNYGYADIARDKLVSDSTLWSVYSISKLVTATALMQLWEQGLFHLDDSVNSYLPQTLQFVNPNHPS
ncbi:MAG: serine hydrolase domain-containing protein, partial [Candidatus Kariarchaeaceae archaeon]